MVKHNENLVAVQLMDLPLSNPRLTEKAWKIPRESLIFCPCWRLKKLGSDVREGCSNSNNPSSSNSNGLDALTSKKQRQAG